MVHIFKSKSGSDVGLFSVLGVVGKPAGLVYVVERPSDTAKHVRSFVQRSTP